MLAKKGRHAAGGGHGKGRKAGPAKVGAAGKQEVKRTGAVSGRKKVGRGAARWETRRGQERGVPLCPWGAACCRPVCDGSAAIGRRLQPQPAKLHVRSDLLVELEAAGCLGPHLILGVTAMEKSDA